MLEKLFNQKDLWQKLAATSKPIVLYGMGDGADKILDICQEKKIPVQGIFASDDFVRHKIFRGHQVVTLREIQKLYPDFIILVAFGTEKPELLQYIYHLATQYELYVPDTPVAGDNLFTGEFVQINKDKIEAAYQLYTDDYSRKVYLHVLHYKLSGDIKYLQTIDTPKEEAFHQLLHLTQAESYLDLGAYNGDTIEEFLSYTNGKYDKIIAIEPDSKNYQKMLTRVKKLNLLDLESYNIGIWHQQDILNFAPGNGRGSTIRQTKHAQQITVNSVDNILQGRQITYIKADVEGAEQSALQGMEKTISLYQPKLSISAYHRSEDLFELPLLIHSLNPNYQLYLRHFPYIPAWESNIFAINQ